MPTMKQVIEMIKKLSKKYEFEEKIAINYLNLPTNKGQVVSMKKVNEMIKNLSDNYSFDEKSARKYLKLPIEVKNKKKANSSPIPLWPHAQLKCKPK
jgi:hypothetical protein